MLLDLATARALAQTDLSDPALQILIDAAEQEIIQRYGVIGADVTYTQERTDYSLQDKDWLFLDRPSASITSVTEYWGDEFAESVTVLDPADYRVMYGGYALQRIGTGPTGRWLFGHRVVVVYRPVDDTARRKEIQSELIKLAVRHSGVQDQANGDTRELSLPNYTLERSRILESMDRSLGFS